jgi:acyl carrier protein
MSTDASVVRNIVREYVHKAAFAEKEKIRDDTLIFTDKFFDSMGFVLLTAFLEETFRLKFTDLELVEENFDSINSISDFIIIKKMNTD